jgi:hypothetical protein
MLFLDLFGHVALDQIVDAATLAFARQPILLIEE